MPSTPSASRLAISFLEVFSPQKLIFGHGDQIAATSKNDLIEVLSAVVTDSSQCVTIVHANLHDRVWIITQGNSAHNARKSEQALEVRHYQ